MNMRIDRFSGMDPAAAAARQKTRQKDVDPSEKGRQKDSRDEVKGGNGDVGKNRGVIRHIQDGHFKEVADIRLRLNFREELKGVEPPSLETIDRAGAAFARFFKLYREMQMNAVPEVPSVEEPPPVLEVPPEALALSAGDFPPILGGGPIVDLPLEDVSPRDETASQKVLEPGEFPPILEFPPVAEMPPIIEATPVAEVRPDSGAQPAAESPPEGEFAPILEFPGKGIDILA
jgi:hypothetical protein